VRWEHGKDTRLTIDDCVPHVGGSPPNYPDTLGLFCLDHLTHALTPGASLAKPTPGKYQPREPIAIRRKLFFAGVNSAAPLVRCFGLYDWWGLL
jgi:hypothetical protein